MLRPPRPTLVLLGVLTLTASCAGPEERTASLTDTVITFAIRVDPSERGAFHELIRRFESAKSRRVSPELVTTFQSQSRIRVELRDGGSAELRREMRSGGSGREPSIDLFALDNLEMRSFVDEDLVEDLSTVPLDDQIVPQMVPMVEERRAPFLPFRPNVRLLYVLSTALEPLKKPPESLDDLRRVAEEFRQRTGEAKVTLSLANGAPAAVTLSELILSFGGDPLRVNDEAAVAAFTFLNGLWNDGLLTRESVVAKHDTEIEYLADGRSWLAQNWTITSAELARRGIFDEFQVFEGWRGPEGARHVIGGDVLGIPKGLSKARKAAALELATYMMSQEAQELLVRRNSWPSIREDAYRHLSPTQKKTIDAAKGALVNGWYRPSVAYWCEVSAGLSEAVDRIVLRNEPARQVLDEINGRIESAKSQQVPCPATG